MTVYIPQSDFFLSWDDGIPDVYWKPLGSSLSVSTCSVGDQHRQASLLWVIPHYHKKWEVEKLEEILVAGVSFHHDVCFRMLPVYHTHTHTHTPLLWCHS